MPWCIERENTTIPLKFLNGLQLQNRSKLLLTSLPKKISREINAKIANSTDGVCAFSSAIVLHDTSWQHRPQGFLVFQYGRQTLETRLPRAKLGKARCKPGEIARGSPGMLCAAVQSSPLSQQLQKLSLSKRGQVRNLSGVNVFYLHETNMKYFSNQ